MLPLGLAIPSMPFWTGCSGLVPHTVRLGMGPHATGWQLSSPSALHMCRYRSKDEQDFWVKSLNPIKRFQKYCIEQGHWSSEDTARIQQEMREEVCGCGRGFAHQCNTWAAVGSQLGHLGIPGECPAGQGCCIAWRWGGGEAYVKTAGG